MKNLKTLLSLGGFWRSENGGGTILGLYISLMIFVMGGLAVDFSHGIEKRAHLQAAADAAALAAAIDLPDTATATAAGMAIANKFSVDDNAISALDFTYGNWDRDTNKFSTDIDLPINVVQVTAGRTTDRGNALATFLLGFVNKDSLDVGVHAVAYAKGDSSCKNGGFFSDMNVNSNSNNDYKNGFCLYGKLGVKISSDNTFEEGVKVIMENSNNFLQGGNNTGIGNALLEATYTLALPEMVDTIIANAPDGIDELPDFITQGPVYMDNIVDTDVLAPHTLYIVTGVADLGSDRNLKNLAIVAGKEIKIGSNNSLYNAVFASPDKILIGSNNQIGHPDGCAHGRYTTYMFSSSNIEFSSNNWYSGMQIGAKGMIKLGSALDGFNDIYAEAYQNIEYGSNEVLGGCPEGLVSDFTGSPEKPTSANSKFALIR